MDRDKEEKSAWLERVEELIDVLEGSSIGELELTEGDIEIVIRRRPAMVLTAAPTIPHAPIASQAASSPAHGHEAAPPRADRSMSINSPLTGVYYSAPSPTMPPFANIGDVIHVGQVVALVEAMKVFNEVTAEISGRVVSFVAKSGEVVQKGDKIMLVEPL
jgi:acetyl-CoA carboxylase biotin carboxyl carrier protein